MRLDRYNSISVMWPTLSEGMSYTLRWIRCGILCLVSLFGGMAADDVKPVSSYPSSVGSGYLFLDEVLHSVTNQYPPLLAALLERELTSQRVQSALGVFDVQMFVRGEVRPSGYYDGSVIDAGVEQYLGLGGASVFGGYRLSRGFLPDYNRDRTQQGGEARLGLRIPLLRDGRIDRERANLLKARLQVELADPVIQRQQLGFLRSSAHAYGNWLATGLRLRAAEELHRTARERMAYLSDQVAEGLLPRIVLIDNERLLIARDLAVVQAQRRFEAATLVLSLFHRDAFDEPVMNAANRVPEWHPIHEQPPPPLMEQHIARALVERPEVRAIQVQLESLEVDRRLARNQRLPQLDAAILGKQPIGAPTYRDREETEVLAGIDLRAPLQQREARGRIGELNARSEQIARERSFLQDQIETEVRDAHSAWLAARRQLERAEQNLVLARTLQEAEIRRFQEGASDLLAVQLREQSVLEALVLIADAQNDGVKAMADYRAAAVLVYPESGSF